MQVQYEKIRSKDFICFQNSLGWLTVLILSGLYQVELVMCGVLMPLCSVKMISKVTKMMLVQDLRSTCTEGGQSAHVISCI